MQINPEVFRKYDIRGRVEQDLSPEFAYLLGRAFAKLAKNEGRKKIAIGWDCRKTSETYADSLAKGLIDEGLDCLILGLCPTPQLYWSLFNLGCDGGVEVTGSHNAISMNGFKLCLGTQAISENRILELLTLMQTLQSESKAPSTPKGHQEFINCRHDYLQDLINRIERPQTEKQLKVVVDAGNGVAGLTGPDALKLLDCKVIEMFCEPNGFFPNHPPDPAVPQNLQLLRARVLQEQADLGIAWDGDGDRIGVIDEKGNYITPDLLLLIYALEILKEEQGAKIVADVKCSDKTFELIKANSGNPIMWKTGHALIKSKLQAENALLGGEFTGHIFFKHRFYGFDDGAYCACRLIEILNKKDLSLSKIIEQFPETYSSDEIRIPFPDKLKFQVIETLTEKLQGLPLTLVDGIRLKFPNGWGLIRASNTEPALSIRVEGDTPQTLQQYRAFIEGIVTEITEQLQ